MSPVFNETSEKLFDNWLELNYAGACKWPLQLAIQQTSKYMDGREDNKSTRDEDGEMVNSLERVNQHGDSLFGRLQNIGLARVTE